MFVDLVDVESCGDGSAEPGEVMADIGGSGDFRAGIDAESDGGGEQCCSWGGVGWGSTTLAVLLDGINAPAADTFHGAP